MGGSFSAITGERVVPLEFGCKELPASDESEQLSDISSVLPAISM